MKKVPSIRDYAPQEHKSPNCTPKGSEPLGSASEGVQFEDCPFGQSRMDYALIYCATEGSKITKCFIPEGVRATDCSRENNLVWITP